MGQFDLESYLSNGVENIIKGILKASVKNPAAGFSMLQYVKESKNAGEIRRKAKIEGKHIPPFLIASISDKCNLKCKGCYAWANQSCSDSGCGGAGGMTDNQWENVFREAGELGISFILLAGGEPLMREGVLKAAGRQKKILFPVFTNGTMIDKDYIDLFAGYRNLMPVLSIEGKEDTTDNRRGKGVFQRLQKAMRDLKDKGILFGVSITVHRENIEEVLEDNFIRHLGNMGCKAVIYVEYVPIDRASAALAFTEEDRGKIEERLKGIREKEKEIIFISFPGDEKNSGGCLAAGRGFFHINSQGSAEPCPFSPYSDTNLKEVTLLEALESPLFRRLKESGTLSSEHAGGCVLFERDETVKELLGGSI